MNERFPDAGVTIGRVNENGFFFGFAYKRPVTPEDLVAIEKRMTEVGAGYFDDVTTVIQGGSSSVKALTGSTEEEQFH